MIIAALEKNSPRITKILFFIFLLYLFLLVRIILYYFFKGDVQKNEKKWFFQLKVILKVLLKLEITFSFIPEQIIVTSLIIIKSIQIYSIILKN